MKKTLLSLLTGLAFNLCANQLHHHDLVIESPVESIYIWEENDLELFDELIVSWDAYRPTEGNYTITVSLFTNTWSEWLDYAYWGVADQYSFNQYDTSGSIKTYQDAAEVLNGENATRFKICVTAQDGASLEHFRSLHACTTNIKEHRVSEGKGTTSLIDLQLAGLSQVALPDERHLRLCSPTSTTAVINYLSRSSEIDPLTFADSIRDSAFDIYGNWVLNTAQASYLLGPSWKGYVARLTSFDQILESLQKGIPVVISIKGAIKGGASVYNEGHLIVIKGYDPDGQKVLCMDPAFDANETTLVSYSLEDLMTAWRRRYGIAYLFFKKQT